MDAFLLKTILTSIRLVSPSRYFMYKAMSRLKEGVEPGKRLPPIRPEASHRVTSKPRSEPARAASNPAGPAPIINSFFLETFNIVSGFQQPITDSLEFVIEKDDNTVSIYPNPFFNYFIISFSIPAQEDMQIKLIGSSGHLFRNMNLKKGSNLVKMEVPELASGQYSLLFVVNNELISVQKIIKIK